MNKMLSFFPLMLILFVHPITAEGKKLKVYILAGQSNMQGMAKGKTLSYMKLDQKTRELHDKMVDVSGNVKRHENVRIVGFSGQSAKEATSKSGPLTIGYGGALDNRLFGPELSFGITMGEHVKEPILIIKTSWGGKNLHTDFRSPSAGPYRLPDSVEKSWENNSEGGNGIPPKIDRETWWKSKIESTGAYYRLMMKCVKEVLQNPSKVCPTYDDKSGYEIAGFVWFQGWNDMGDRMNYPKAEGNRYRPYGDLLSHFIRDVRKDLNSPQMPFVIGVMGVDGKDNRMEFREGMAEPASREEFMNNVIAVETAPFWDETLGDFGLSARKFKYQSLREWGNVSKTMSQEEIRKKYPGHAALTYSHKRRKELMLEKFGKEKLALLSLGTSNAPYHYMGAAKILAPIGEAFAHALIDSSRGN